MQVANGKILSELCKEWDVPFGSVSQWIYCKPERDKAYRAACNARAELYVEKLIHELRQIALVDIRQLYNGAGGLLPPHEWPDDIAKAVAGVDTFEEFGAEGEKLGETKKVKLWDKLKAIELAGKNLSLFIDKTEVKHTVTLEDIVAGSIAQDK